MFGKISLFSLLCILCFLFSLSSASGVGVFDGDVVIPGTIQCEDIFNFSSIIVNGTLTFQNCTVEGEKRESTFKGGLLQAKTIIISSSSQFFLNYGLSADTIYNYGYIEVARVGNNIIRGNLINEGTIKVSFLNCDYCNNMISIEGNYVQTASGIMISEPGEDMYNYYFLNYIQVSGEATLAGTAYIDVKTDKPKKVKKLPIIVANKINGKFDGVVSLVKDDLQYTSTGVFVKIKDKNALIIGLTVGLVGGISIVLAIVGVVLWRKHSEKGFNTF